MSAAASAAITEKGQYHSDKLGALVMLVVFLLVVALGLLALTFFLFRYQSPPPVFFHSSERGELIAEVPLDQSNLTPNALLNWVTENLMENNTFNFVNYPSVIEKAREDFTVEGYESYTKALETSGVLPDVIKNKYVVRASARSAPQITKEGVLANRYLWKIKVLMTFAYKNVNAALYNDAEIILLVMRVPTQQSPYGIRILKYDLTVKKSGL